MGPDYTGGYKVHQSNFTTSSAQSNNAFKDVGILSNLMEKIIVTIVVNSWT
jgi:hypothetical protein